MSLCLCPLTGPCILAKLASTSPRLTLLSRYSRRQPPTHPNHVHERSVRRFGTSPSRQRQNRDPQDLGREILDEFSELKKVYGTWVSTHPSLAYSS